MLPDRTPPVKLPGLPFDAEDGVTAGTAGGSVSESPRTGTDAAMSHSPLPTLPVIDRTARWVLRRSDSNGTKGPLALAAWYGYLTTVGLLAVVGFFITEVSGGTQSLDARILDAAVEHRYARVVDAMSIASRLTNTWPVVAMLATSTILLAWHRRWRLLAFFGTAVVIELTGFVTLSYLVARPRPDESVGMLPATNSYPSGHTAMAVVVFVGFGLLTRFLSSDDRVRAWAPWLGAIVALVVGGSRVYLGFHFFSDVVAGFVLGALALTVGLIAARIVERRTVEPVTDQDGERRRITSGRVRVAGTAALVGLLLWSVAVEPRHMLEVQNETGAIDNLPAEWEGRRFGIIADLQIGLWFDNVGMARRAVDVLVSEEPAFVLVLGDLVYGDDTDETISTAVDVLRPLTDAGVPTLAVLGNHDYKADAASPLAEALEQSGVTVLRNEATEVTIDGVDQPLWVVGVGPERPGRADPAAAFGGLPSRAPRVVMMHNPLTFEELTANQAPLAVAGHSHGGQIRLPFLPHWSYLRLVKGEAVSVDGWNEDIDGAAGNHLFVNRGIGMSGVPARLNASPAITFFTLRPTT